MDNQEVIDRFRETLTVKRVFGEPIQQDGVTLIPAAMIRGGAGGGSGEGPEKQGQGSGLGYGLAARPQGVFVIRSGHVTWRPAVDVNRLLWGFQFVAVMAFMMFGRILGKRGRRR
ncbi:MAG: spore germination protein GerW family protein [Myxococcaceae bacterium]